MPQVVRRLRQQRHLLPAGRGQAAQRKPVEKAPAREQHDEQDGEQEPRDRVADDHHPRRPDVETRPVAYRLGDAERDRDEVHEQRGPQPERDRDRHLLEHQIHDGPVLEEALAEVEADVAPQHPEEALVRRPVEAELPFELLDELRIEPPGAAVLAGDAVAGAASRSSLLQQLGRPRAAHPRGSGRRRCLRRSR